MMSRFTFVLWTTLSIASILAGAVLLGVHSVSASEISTKKGMFLVTHDFGVAQPYASAIMKAARQYDLEPELIAAVIIKESCVASAPYYADVNVATKSKTISVKQLRYRCIRLNPYAQGGVGERGLMQIRPYHVTTPDALWNPALNIMTGTRLLRGMINGKGSIYVGLLAYNAGPNHSVYYNQKYANDVLNTQKDLIARRKTSFAIAAF